MHVKIFSDYHIAPEQNRLFSTFMISSSGLSLKSSLANAVLIFLEVLHVQPWTFLSQPQGQSMRATIRLPRGSSCLLLPRRAFPRFGAPEARAAFELGVDTPRAR